MPADNSVQQDGSVEDGPTITVGHTVAGEGDGGLPPEQEATLPIKEVLTGRAFITGKSGSGKSNTTGVVAEKLLRAGHPLLLIDAGGEHYSLKEEFEILHVGGGEECDLRVGPEHADRLTDLALNESVPIVLDLSGFLEEDRRDEVVYEFTRHLFHKQKSVRRPFLMVVEEMHEFIPEKGSLGEVGRMLVRVGKRGRKHGLGILGLSQRPADVKKDYITQCDWMVWHRLTWDNDTNVVRRVLDSTYANAVEDFDDGEAFLYADFLEPDIRRVQMERKQTFDAGATPGLDDVDRPNLKSIGDSLSAELEEISEQADNRQDELERLESRVEELEETVAEKDQRIERLLDLREMLDQTEGIGSVESQETVTLELSNGSVSVPEELRAEVLEIKHERDDYEEELGEVRAERDRLAERVDDLETELADRPSTEDYDALHSDLTEFVDRHSDLLGIDAVSERQVEQLRSRIETLEQENESLRQRASPEFDEIADILSHEIIQSEVRDAVENQSYSEQHYWDLLTIMGDTGWLSIDQLAPYSDLARSSVSNILSTLAETQVVERQSDGQTVQYRFDEESATGLIERQQKREAIREQSSTFIGE